MKRLLKIYYKIVNVWGNYVTENSYFDSHFDIIPENLGNMSKEHGERFK